MEKRGAMWPESLSRVQQSTAGVHAGVCLLTIAITIPSSIDAAVSLAFNEHYGVNAMAGFMTAGMYLIGNETFGRKVMYMTNVAFVVFMLFVLAKALAPNFGVALVFFLTGFFGSTPMTATGGSVADIWNPLEMMVVVPVGAITAYAGPLLGPIIGAYVPEIGFHRADWISLILAGAVPVFVFLFQPETYRPVEEYATTRDLGRRFLVNIYRPFVLTHNEPIILIFTLYLTIIYFVLFTFLKWPLTFILFAALLIGNLAAIPLVPLIYGWAKKTVGARTLTPELCLWNSMLGGSAMLPISLWWLAWTCYPHISIWVPIVGSVFFGYGLVTHSASALAFITCIFYVVAGALLLASVPMYENLGPHRALTIPCRICCIGTALGLEA
ncbi:major facilitator superfamily domain-containing protein [Podospora didyma]|uniref:Major facilitator superfamily domain-containing protein n=1 Tax=Podospora didyma TaxID=330526 RepID=A0AAE0NXK8_9PEZI|nr:major facilitator superfamily domain-containing protein [Podospora didyma]